MSLIPAWMILQEVPSSANTVVGFSIIFCLLESLAVSVCLGDCCFSFNVKTASSVSTGSRPDSSDQLQSSRGLRWEPPANKLRAVIVGESLYPYLQWQCVNEKTTLRATHR
jgi:hypothetical protein